MTVQAAGGTTVDWNLGATCVIFMERWDGGEALKLALWMESHLPWFVEVEDEYTMDSVGGATVPVGTAKPKLKRGKIYSEIHNNEWIDQSKVIIVATERNSTRLNFAGKRLPVERNPTAGHASHNIAAIRRNNTNLLTGCNRDLVVIFDEILHHHKVGELPWNRAYSLLCSLGVHFQNPQNKTWVTALHTPLVRGARAALGSWNTATEIAVMSGLCKIEHEGARWCPTSQHDIKIGAVKTLWAVETILDSADMEDDLYNLSDLVSRVQSWQIRMASVVDFVNAQENGILLEANSLSAVSRITNYRWTPPHTFRLSNTSGSPLAMDGFKQAIDPGRWFHGRCINVDRAATTNMDLNQV